MKRGPMDPALIEAWNKGRKSGKNDAIEEFAKYLQERMVTLKNIPGIGDTLALRVFEHFHEGMEDE